MSDFDDVLAIVKRARSGRNIIASGVVRTALLEPGYYRDKDTGEWMVDIAASTGPERGERLYCTLTQTQAAEFADRLDRQADAGVQEIQLTCSCGCRREFNANYTLDEVRNFAGMLRMVLTHIEYAVDENDV